MIYLQTHLKKGFMETCESWSPLYIQLLGGTLAIPLTWDTMAPAGLLSQQLPPQGLHLLTYLNFHLSSHSHVTLAHNLALFGL